MEAKKTLKSAVVELTKIKRKQLERMWSNYQQWLHTKKGANGVYSAHKQQAGRNLDLDDLTTLREFYSLMKSASGMQPQ